MRHLHMLRQFRANVIWIVTFWLQCHISIFIAIIKLNIVLCMSGIKFTSDTVAVLPDCPSYDLPPLVNIECSTDLVRAVLESIPVNKACGPDGVSARIIRECSDALSVPLAKICRLSIGQGVFPELWKRANVVPVFKKGSVKDPRCYRSVSLIPLFGKILEKVAYVSLMRHVEPVIAPEQHGFVRGRSCATNLATLLSTACVTGCCTSCKILGARTCNVAGVKIP